MDILTVSRLVQTVLNVVTTTSLLFSTCDGEDITLKANSSFMKIIITFYQWELDSNKFE